MSYQNATATAPHTTKGTATMCRHHDTAAENRAERAQDRLDARYLRGTMTDASYARACRRIAHAAERAAWQRSASPDHFAAVARRMMEG